MPEVSSTKTEIPSSNENTSNVNREKSATLSKDEKKRERTKTKSETARYKREGKGVKDEKSIKEVSQSVLTDKKLFKRWMKAQEVMNKSPLSNSVKTASVALIAMKYMDEKSKDAFLSELAG